MSSNGIDIYDTYTEGRSTFQSTQEQALGYLAPDYLGQTSEAVAPAPVTASAAADALDRTAATIAATGSPALQNTAALLARNAAALRGPAPEPKIFGFKRKHVVVGGLGLAALYLIFRK